MLYKKGDLLILKIKTNPIKKEIICWYYVNEKQDYTVELFPEDIPAIYLNRVKINGTRFHKLMIKNREYYICNDELYFYARKLSY